LAEQVKDKEMEMYQIKQDIDRIKTGQGASHASGFSIGDSENDQLKNKLRALNEKFNEEKKRTEEVSKQTDEEVTA
jgi:hypothetical protein